MNTAQHIDALYRQNEELRRELTDLQNKLNTVSATTTRGYVDKPVIPAKVYAKGTSDEDREFALANFVVPGTGLSLFGIISTISLYVDIEETDAEPAVGDIVFVQHFVTENPGTPAEKPIYVIVSSAGAGISHFVMKEEQADYLICRKVIADDESFAVYEDPESPLITVAKPWPFRRSSWLNELFVYSGRTIAFTENIGGPTHSRKATTNYLGEAWIEKQEITPPYAYGEIIHAINTTTGVQGNDLTGYFITAESPVATIAPELGGPVPVEWLDLGIGRGWATRVEVESAECAEGE